MKALIDRSFFPKLDIPMLIKLVKESRHDS